MPSTPSRTIVVLGAAYAGYRAAQVLAAGVPDDWRIVVIDKSTHFNRELGGPLASTQTPQLIRRRRLCVSTRLGLAWPRAQDVCATDQALPERFSALPCARPGRASRPRRRHLSDARPGDTDNRLRPPRLRAGLPDASADQRLEPKRRGWYQAAGRRVDARAAGGDCGGAERAGDRWWCAWRS